MVCPHPHCIYVFTTILYSELEFDASVPDRQAIVMRARGTRDGTNHGFVYQCKFRVRYYTVFFNKKLQECQCTLTATFAYDNSVKWRTECPCLGRNWAYPPSSASEQVNFSDTVSYIW